MYMYVYIHTHAFSYARVGILMHMILDLQILLFECAYINTYTSTILCTCGYVCKAYI